MTPSERWQRIRAATEVPCFDYVIAIAVPAPFVILTWALDGPTAGATMAVCWALVALLAVVAALLHLLLRLLFWLLFAPRGDA